MIDCRKLTDAFLHPERYCVRCGLGAIRNQFGLCVLCDAELEGRHIRRNLEITYVGSALMNAHEIHTSRAESAFARKRREQERLPVRFFRVKG